MEKTTHEHMQSCCGAGCGTGCCKGHLWKWLLGILAVLAIFWLGMYVGFSKAMWHRGGGDWGKGGGGCMMGNMRGNDSKGGCTSGNCPMKNAVQDATGTVTTGS